MSASYPSDAALPDLLARPLTIRVEADGKATLTEDGRDTVPLGLQQLTMTNHIDYLEMHFRGLVIRRPRA